MTSVYFTCNIRQFIAKHIALRLDLACGSISPGLTVVLGATGSWGTHSLLQNSGNLDCSGHGHQQQGVSQGCADTSLAFSTTTHPWICTNLYPFPPLPLSAASPALPPISLRTLHTTAWSLTRAAACSSNSSTTACHPQHRSSIPDPCHWPQMQIHCSCCWLQPGGSPWGEFDTPDL